MKYETEDLIGPIEVDANIPAELDNLVSEEQILNRLIPTPADMQVKQEIARGTFGRIHMVTDKNLPHPFGFSLLGDNLYWTDWQDRSIQRANKTDGGDRLVMVSHLDDLVS